MVQSTDLPELAEDGSQMYGMIVRLVGGDRMTVLCNDNKEWMCKICGSMRKREWVNAGDFVKISTREWDGSTADGMPKGDIIMKLNKEQEKILRKDPRYPVLATLRGGKGGATLQQGIIFDGEASDEESDSSQKGEEVGFHK